MRDRAPLSYLEQLPHRRFLCRRGLLPSQGCRSVPGKAPPRTQPPPRLLTSLALPPFRAGPVPPRCPGAPAAPAQGASHPSWMPGWWLWGK